MSDLTTAAGEALQQMTALETRAGEVQASIARVEGKASAERLALESDQARMQAAVETLFTNMGDIQTKFSEAADHSHDRVGAQMEQVEQLAKQLIDRQKATHERLAALRASLGKIVGDLLSRETQLSADLLKVRALLAAQFAATVSVLTRTEEALTLKVVPGVRGVGSSIADRTSRFQQHVNNDMLPRLDGDAAGFVARMLALAKRLTDGFDQAHSTTTATATTRVAEFLQKSGTDWNGGGGNVEEDAAQRSLAMGTVGQEKSRIVDGLTSKLAGVTGDFGSTMANVQARYNAIHALPGHIDSILREHGF